MGNVPENRLHPRLHVLGEENTKKRIVEFDQRLKFLGVLFKGGILAHGGVGRQQVQAENSQPVQPAGSKKRAGDFDGFNEHDKRVGVMLL